MTALSEPDRNRLIKILGLLSSNHLGERAEAAAAAHRFLMQKGVSWEQLLTPQPAQNRLTHASWRDTCQELLQRARVLTPWERRFVADLQKLPRVTLKQRRFLGEISARVLGAGL